MVQLKVGSDFSGVGAFNHALDALFIDYREVFACDMDKHARATFIHNYGEPEYYPENVYDRAIPEESLDIYMTSPPCQAFSLAGKRLGKEDPRGVLFFNSLEFIEKNKPRFFIFENVKGLLSHDKQNKKDKIGETFKEWLGYLGGKSLNDEPNPYLLDGAVPYHIYYKVLNAKKHGVPQNRERVFIIGIRDDADKGWTWPEEVELNKRLRDVLEPVVDEKYFLSDKMVEQLTTNTDHLIPGDVSKTIRVGGGGGSTDKKHAFDVIKVVGNTNPCWHGMKGNVFDEDGISPTLSTNKGEGIKVRTATKLGYEVAEEGDSINFSNPNSETRRGRVGRGVAQTLDTACNQGTLVHTPFAQFEADGLYTQDSIRFAKAPLKGISRCLKANKHDAAVYDGYRIRRLTPRECFRLMDFPDSFTWPVSDTQAYKQAGNSIVRKHLIDIIAQIYDKITH